MEFPLKWFPPINRVCGGEENQAKVVLVNDKENNQTRKASIEHASPNWAKY
jgi:hypothetical protein